jgi:hypothetical protein
MRLLSVMLGVALLCGACANPASPAEHLQSRGRGSALNESANPIAQLDMRAVSFVAVEPMVVGGGWIELRADGSNFVLHSTGPAGLVRPSGMCEIGNETATALIAILASADGPEPASEPQLGDYSIRIRVGDKIITGRVMIGERPGIQARPALAIGDRQYRLDPSRLDTLGKLIASARCLAAG